MNRVTSLLLCFILALLWMIVARLSLNIEHSDVVIDNSESDKNEASVMNVADANKVVSGAAVRVVGDADADKSGRAEVGIKKFIFHHVSFIIIIIILNDFYYYYYLINY